MLGRLARGELGFERGDLPVANLCDALQVALALGALGLHAELVDAARDLLDALERFPLDVPARGERALLLLRLGERALERLAHGSRLLGHRGELDLELHDTA